MTAMASTTLAERAAHLRADFLSSPEGHNMMMELSPIGMAPPTVTVQPTFDMVDFCDWSQSWSQSWPQSYERS